MLILACVLIASAFLFGTTILISGFEHSLNSGLERLGADIIVIPTGSETGVETALLMGKPTDAWMPADVISNVAAVPGVGQVSGQMYLKSLYNAPCCSVSEMFLVAIDPETDFSIKPWLENNLMRSLQPGEVIGGSYIFVPEGEPLKLYGCELSLVGNLEATGTGIDNSMFMTLDTARLISEASITAAISPLQIPDDSISAVMVKTSSGSDRHKVCLDIRMMVPGVTALESPGLFGTFRRQFTSLLWGTTTISLVFWSMIILLIAIIMAMSVNERRRDIAVLFALGATRTFMTGTLIIEAGILTISGAVAGILAAWTLLSLFSGYIINALGIPLLLPALPSVLATSALVLLLMTTSVALAVIMPVISSLRREPALAVRA
jgi:putative ABC transport system permease protein